MIQVSCALLLQHNRVLIAQRSANMRMPGKWEFPGGKREADESLSHCLKRELFEEFGIQIQVRQALPSVIHAYPEFTIALFPFWCTWEAGVLQPKEHQKFTWCLPEELYDYDWAAADLPIVQAIAKEPFPLFSASHAY